jgi:hypothetical protein
MLYVSIVIYLIIVALPVSALLWAAGNAAKWGDGEK